MSVDLFPFIKEEDFLLSGLMVSLACSAALITPSMYKLNVGPLGIYKRVASNLDFSQDVGKILACGPGIHLVY